MREPALMSISDGIGRLAERIEAAMGLDFSEAKRRDLLGAVQRMAQSRGIDEDACMEWLLGGSWDKEKNDLCAHHLTIGETYFFREPRAFDLVCDYARKKMSAFGGAAQLRIWSAGCCTGEEPYSIAMALREAVPELRSEAIRIFATDINVRHLRFAREGVYRQWSFRNAEPSRQRASFSEEGGNQFRLCEDIKALVRFGELNLAEPAYPSAATNTQAMDIIFCRNVLMYFSRSQARKVIERFRRCLVDGGWLIVNPSEASAELFDGFSAVYYPDAIHFRKNAFDSGPAAGPLKELGHIAPPRFPAPDKKADVFQEKKENRKAQPVRKAAPDQEQDLPSAESFHASAFAAIEAGDPRNAIRNLKQALYLEPDDIVAHYLMGVLQSAQGRHAEASRQFEAAGELLAFLDEDAIVPGSDGLSAAYLRESISFYLHRIES